MIFLKPVVFNHQFLHPKLLTPNPNLSPPNPKPQTPNLKLRRYWRRRWRRWRGAGDEGADGGVCGVHVQRGAAHTAGSRGGRRRPRGHWVGRGVHVRQGVVLPRAFRAVRRHRHRVLLLSRRRAPRPPCRGQGGATPRCFILFTIIQKIQPDELLLPNLWTSVETLHHVYLTGPLFGPGPACRRGRGGCRPCCRG